MHAMHNVLTRLYVCACWSEPSFLHTTLCLFCGEPWGVSSEMHEILYKSPNVTKLGYVRPTKIQLSLCISAVWSESSLSAFWILKDTRFPHPINEDSDQISQPRWFEYSMGAHVRRYLFSCWGSYCVFSIFITTKKTKFVYNRAKVVVHVIIIDQMYEIRVTVMFSRATLVTVTSECRVKMVIYKTLAGTLANCGLRSVTEDCGVWSGSALFA